MSYRTTVEFNHDYAHKLNEDHSRWMPDLFMYFNSASKDYFPKAQGIKLIKTQHHSDKDLISDYEWRLGKKDKEIESLADAIQYADERMGVGLDAMESIGVVSNPIEQARDRLNKAKLELDTP